MPNWCFVTITADPKVLADMIDDEGNATFEKLLPIPEELKATTSPTPKDVDEKQIEYLLEKYGSSNWFDWSVSNWGTKWNATTDDPYIDGDNFVAFRVPWDQPDEFIWTLSRKHPEETIRVEWEEEQDQGQVYEIKNGEIVKVLEEWHIPEWGEEYEVGDYIIQECLSNGGRYDTNVPKWHKGKFYIDMDEDQEYSTLEEAKQAAEEM